MILVPIHKASKSPSVDDDDDEDDTPQEWSLLELNGEIQTPRQQQIVDDDAMELGSIEYDHEVSEIHEELVRWLAIYILLSSSVVPC